MAKKGDNIKALADAVISADADLTQIESNRQAVASDAAEVYARLEALGIDRWALRHARRYMKLDPNKRRALDTAYGICRQALGEPVQNDLFDQLQPIERKRGRPAKGADQAEGDGETTH